MNPPSLNKDSIDSSRLIIITANHYLKNGINNILLDLLPRYIQRTERVLHAHFYREIDDIPEVGSRQQDVSHIIIDEASTPCSLEAISRLAKKVPGRHRYLLLDAQITPYPGRYSRLSTQLPVEDIRQQMLHFLSSDCVTPSQDLPLFWQALSSRDKLILRLLSQGVKIRTIAQDLAISVQTVYACRNRAMKKAGVSRLPPFLQQIKSASDVRQTMCSKDTQ